VDENTNLSIFGWGRQCLVCVGC